MTSRTVVGFGQVGSRRVALNDVSSSDSYKRSPAPLGRIANVVRARVTTGPP